MDQVKVGRQMEEVLMRSTTGESIAHRLQGRQALDGEDADISLLNVNALNLGSGNAGSGGDASSGNAIGGDAGCHY